jgi:hypothetical protein
MTLKRLLALLIALAPALVVAQPDLTLDLDQTRLLIPVDVRFERMGNGVLIEGTMVKRAERRGRLLGHAHVQVLSAEGQVLTAREAPLTNFRPSARNPDQGDFTARIDPLPAGSRVLRIEYDAGRRTGNAGDSQ